MKLFDTSSPLTEFAEKPIDMGTRLSISVVIIAKNAKETICYTLDSLRKQSKKPDEIIVVVSSSDANTPEALKEYPEVRLVTVNGSTRGHHRSSGIQYVRGDIIAFIDADCVAHSEWLKSLESLYSEREDILVQGGPIAEVQDLGQVHQQKILLGKEPHFRYVKSLTTANISFRRRVLDTVGSFDESLHEGEDLDFCLRLLKHRVTCVLNLGAIVYHATRTLHSSVKRSISYGKSRARLFFMYERYLLPAALVAIIHIILIFASILALIINRHDIFIIAAMSSVAHQFYSFQRSSSNAPEKVLSVKKFAISTISSYALYASFVVHLLYYLVLHDSAARKDSNIIRKEMLYLVAIFASFF